MLKWLKREVDFQKVNLFFFKHFFFLNCFSNRFKKKTDWNGVPQQASQQPIFTHVNRNLCKENSKTTFDIFLKHFLLKTQIIIDHQIKLWLINTDHQQDKHHILFMSNNRLYINQTQRRIPHKIRCRSLKMWC